MTSHADGQLTDAELDALVDSLTLAEQVGLLAGSDIWHTTAIADKGIPAMRVTDGPAGARGTSFDGPASVNVPCGTALAATWDPTLIEEIGVLLGLETRAKGARVLLAPTVNLHRTPVGGRNFECQSEDPYLSARITVGYVRGLQSQGVSSCVKHFVGNDTEFERMTIDNQIDERTLRELYLVPFEAAVKEAGATAVMTSYNRVNGPFGADHRENITDILRGEWGFDGIVMSDWFGLHSTTEAVHAGLDLEMPGPPIHRGAKLVAAVEQGTCDPADVRAAAWRMLRFMDRIGALADGGPGPETTRDDPADRALLRSAGAAGMVLLRNEHEALPLKLDDGIAKVAVIGPNAARGRIQGGGSAHVNPVHNVQPLEALRTRLGDEGVQVLHAQGCLTHKRLPRIEPRLLSPLRLELFPTTAALDGGGPAAVVEEVRALNFRWFEPPAPEIPMTGFAGRVKATFTPDVTGEWTFGVTSVGDARLLIDGQVVADNQGLDVGGSFFGMGKAEQIGTVTLEAQRAYDFTVDYRRGDGGTLAGLVVGAIPPVTSDLVNDAARLAATTDVSIIVVGTNEEWESEGYDRDSIDLPGEQDRLISEVAAVSPRTIVVINAGSPVAMPWIDEVDAVIFAWFPGQEFGDALTDVLMGNVEPGGRLPVTLPRRLEDSPAFEHHPGRNSVGRYLEGRLMGYRWFDTTGREPLFPFGHGLGYASIEIVSAQMTRVEGRSALEVELRNSSEHPGHEVVQVYAHDTAASEVPDDPDQRLVGFTKVHVAAGATTTAHVPLDPRWASHWDVASHDWVVSPGRRELRVGHSSRNIAVTIPVEVPVEVPVDVASL